MTSVDASRDSRLLVPNYFLLLFIQCYTHASFVPLPCPSRSACRFSRNMYHRSFIQSLNLMDISLLLLIIIDFCVCFQRQHSKLLPTTSSNFCCCPSEVEKKDMRQIRSRFLTACDDVSCCQARRKNKGTTDVYFHDDDDVMKNDAISARERVTQLKQHVHIQI